MNKIIVTGLGIVLLAGTVRAETNAPAALDEVIKALREHYVDREKLDAPALDAATIKGILTLLGRGATLVTPADPVTNAPPVSLSMTNAPVSIPEPEPLARAEIIAPSIGYLRISDVEAATVPAVDTELNKFSAAKCDGYILDLRFADGTNWMAAAELAGRFFADERELFAVKSAGGEELFKAHTHTAVENAADLASAPLILLVNSQTRGAAEALAGALRAQDRGVVVGSLTAGSPAATEDVPLGDGRVLRVVTSKVVLRPAEPQSVANVDIFPHGVAPDIYVPLELTIEHDVVLNASTNVTLTVSLQPHTPKKRPSEADLVKMFRGEAVDAPDEDAPITEADTAEIQKVRDVVLQRAVDVLKGIRVLLSWQ